MPPGEEPSLDHHRDGSEKGPAVAKDSFGFSTDQHGQQQRPDEIGSEPLAASGSGAGAGGLLLPARRSVAEAVVVVVPPRLFVAAAGEGIRPEGGFSARSTADRRSPERYAARAAKRSVFGTDSLQRRQPPPPQPTTTDGQQQEAPLGGTHSERRALVERLLPESSSVDSFESSDGLLLPDSYTGPRGLDLVRGDGGGGGRSGGGPSGVGVLGFSDADEFAEAELTPAAAGEEGEALFTPMRDNSTEMWAMSRASRFLSVAAFWASHTCSVYATKALLSRPGRTLRTVVLITWFQCLVSFMLVLSLGTLGDRQDSRKGAWRSGLLTEMARALPPNALLGGWNSKSLLGGGAEAVGLASVLFSLAVFADNACLGVVNASFFQVARALTLPFVTVMGAVGSRALPPRDLLLPCVLCVVGFSLGVQSQTPEAFADGTSMGVMASLLTAAYTRLLARAEPREAWRVTYVTNRNASVILVPVAVYVGMGDPNDFSGEPFLLKDGSTILLAVMATLLPAVAGVCTMWQAQARLGARGLAASSVGRAAFSHLLAFRVFGNAKVLIGEVGCCLVLTGLALYASCRGGAAVAQAGNVAVPGAAREHFLPASSSSPSVPAPSASPPSDTASASAPSPAGGAGTKPGHHRLGKRKAPPLLGRKTSGPAFGDDKEVEFNSREGGVNGREGATPVKHRRHFPGVGRGGGAFPTSWSKEDDRAAGDDTVAAVEEGGGTYRDEASFERHESEISRPQL
ncbi:unnamed protein product [Ectocarpus sp. CCAP 1310/34]|nr:unnamed protein product [Ectocarpus sp. CCAP 1310/34]